MRDGKGYLIPNQVDPGDLVCFRVYVPAHTTYIGAFWAAYQFFTTWLAWARDPLHRGKQAAAVWRRAYDKARAEYTLLGGRCEMNVTGIRQNPLNACELQIEFDGNNQWIAVADLSKCAGGAGSLPAMRYDGINIQIYNSCSGAWETQGEPTTPAIMPSGAPYPTAPSDGACNGSVALGDWLERTKNKFMDVALVADIAGVVAAGFLALMADEFGVTAVLEPVLVWAIDIIADGYGYIAGAKGVNIADTLKCLLIRYMGRDGLIPIGSLATLADDIAEVRDSYMRPSNDWTAYQGAWAIVKFNSIAGLARGVAFGDIAGADCSDCGWRKVFDFAVSDQGWSKGLTAAYTPGEGWTDDLLSLDGYTYRGVDIRKGMPDTTITKIQLDYVATLGLDEVPGGGRVVQFFDDLQDLNHLLHQEATASGTNIVTWTGTLTNAIALIIATNCGNAASPTPPGGTMKLRKLTLEGTGSNPY